MFVTYDKAETNEVIFNLKTQIDRINKAARCTFADLGRFAKAESSLHFTVCKSYSQNMDWRRSYIATQL